MAVSELQSRLEHLVTYSSQLIFISGDSVASQQRSLQAFVSQQSDNTEIAFINAEPEHTIAQYRQQIVRQLLGPEAPLLNRPLNELLSSLNQHDGPVLIFICEAQHIPQKFLQELWELVLQSRFAANKQHLNVLLFGETHWTEQAKAWLPANNRDKPLLLSTESISSQAQSTPSQLDKMIAEKRRQFEQRLKDRATAQIPPPSNLSTWWFRLIVAFAFLSVFAGIMLWQYSDQFDAVVGSLQDNSKVNTETKDAEASQEDKGETSSSSMVLAEDVNAVTDDAIADVTSNDEYIKYEIVERPANQNISSENNAETRDDQRLVTSWQAAVADIQDKSQRRVDQTEPMATADPDVVEVVAAAQSSEFVENQQDLTSGEDEPAFPQDLGLSDTLDYQVEDIVSVDQLPQGANANSEETQVAINDAIEQSTEKASLAAVETGSLSDAVSSLSDQREQEAVKDNNNSEPLTEALAVTPLESLNKDHFVIQIAGIADKQVLQEFLQDNNITQQVWTYKTQRYGGDWFVVIYAADYTSIDLARTAMEELPPVMQRGTPFVKSVNRVHNEMQIQ